MPVLLATGLSPAVCSVYAGCSTVYARLRGVPVPNEQAALGPVLGISSLLFNVASIAVMQ